MSFAWGVDLDPASLGNNFYCKEENTWREIRNENKFKALIIKPKYINNGNIIKGK